MIDLQRFCSEWNKRVNIPWSRGEYTFATDGRIIVRLPRMADIPEKVDAPDALILWQKVSISGDPIPIPDLPPPKMMRCEDCPGESTAAIAECEECNGTGMVRDIQNTEVDGMFFADKYLELIKELPNYKFYPVKYDFPASGAFRADPSPFNFDGGDGLLMPVKV